MGQRQGRPLGLPLKLVVALVALAGACTKVAPPKTNDQPAPLAAGAPGLKVDASARVAETKAPPLPALTQGKTLGIKGLETVPLEITAPANFRFRMHEGGEDFSPRGHIEGPGSLDIEISQPDGGFFPLSKQRQILEESDPLTAIHRAEETPEGFLLVYRDVDRDGDPQFGAIVSRPKLGVRCEVTSLSRLADAELAASVCLSLRARARPVVDLAALPPLRPLTDGKLVHIQGLKPGPLDITVPRTLKFRLGHSVSPSGPDANFDNGLDLKIVIGPPREEKFLTLAERRALVSKENLSASVVRADETEAGFLLIVQETVSGFGEGYRVIASRPALKVECGTTAAETLAEAERLASACLSLRAPVEGAPVKGQ